MSFYGSPRRKSLKTFGIIFLVLYFVSILFAFKKLFNTEETSIKFENSEERSSSLKSNNSYFGHKNQMKQMYDWNIADKNQVKRLYEVDIWGKASIGLYIWSHILGGNIYDQKVMVQSEKLRIKNITFTFRTGPGLVPTTAPQNVTHLVLILNGRSSIKVQEAKVWLDSLPAYQNLMKVAIVILGDEQCDNEWILPYMYSRGGLINICFLTYDSPLVDNREFFQWPLGVAVYRDFPDVKPERLDITSSRPYLCNFVGTFYKNSSREKMLKIIESSENLKDDCLVIGRKEWRPTETNESRQLYIESLLKSDLTLCPVGFNTECYRIYEALSMGSVPVIEDRMTAGSCDKKSTNSPLRLLKAYAAPVLYLKDWSQLPSILKQESMMPYSKKVARRSSIINWYKNFKRSMSIEFTNIIYRKFFEE